MRRSITAIAALLLVSCGGQDQAGNASTEGNEAATASGGDGGGGAAAASFEPGQWETTTAVTRLNMAGMPAGVTPPMPPQTTISYCMTPDKARRPDANFLTGSSEGSGCSYTDFTMSGGRIQGIVQCNQQGTSMRTAMSGRFTATGYEMTQQVQVTAGGITTDMESRTTGRRVGDCPAG